MKTKTTKRKSSTYGKPVYKRTVSEILVCDCGNKYIKTRKNQKTCLRCMHGII